MLSIAVKKEWISRWLQALCVVWWIGSVCSRGCCERQPPFWKNDSMQRPIIIGHRGAPSQRPEHTLVSYQLAIDLGADFIEVDVVATKDHVLIARHENDISGTTDVEDHPEFLDRHTTKVIDGQTVTGWFTEDFTLEEIKTLRVRERIPDVRPQNTPFDTLYDIPTMEEAIHLAKKYNVGLYPETKHPTYFESLGLPLEQLMVNILHAHGFDKPDDKVFIQSFEVASLIKMRNLTKLPLIQLIGANDSQPYDHIVSGNDQTYSDMITPEGLADIAVYAQGIGPQKNLLFIANESDENTNCNYQSTSLVSDAHKLNLVIHPWTFRNENEFLPPNYQLGNSSRPDFQRSMGNSPAEYCDYFCLGIDGLFTDHADTAAAVRAKIFNPCPDGVT